MMDLRKRITRLEGVAFSQQHRDVRQFVIEAPESLPESAAVAFLRSCGHDMRDEDLNIVRVVVGAEDGRPVDLPLKDLTEKYRPAVSPLNLQRADGR